MEKQHHSATVTRSVCDTTAEAFIWISVQCFNTVVGMLEGCLNVYGECLMMSTLYLTAKKP